MIRNAPWWPQIWPFRTLINANIDTFFIRYAQNYEQSGSIDYSNVVSNHKTSTVMFLRSMNTVESSEFISYLLQNAPFSHFHKPKQATRPRYQLFPIKNVFFTMQSCAINKCQCNVWPHNAQHHAFSNLCTVRRWTANFGRATKSPTTNTIRLEEVNSVMCQW